MFKGLALKFVPPALTFFILVGALELAARMGWVQSYLLPAPSEVLESLIADRQEYINSLLQTLFESMTGLFLSVLIGLTVATLLSISKWLERALYPYAVFFQTVPIISVAPLLVVWFGFGFKTVVVSALIVSVFPVIASTLSGMRVAEPALLDLFRLYGATPFQTLYKLRIPAALPSIVTGVRIAAGLAMIGAIVGEFIAGGGLGGLIDSARTQQRLDKVFAAVLISSLAGILILATINLLTRTLFWRFRELKGEI